MNARIVVLLSALLAGAAAEASAQRGALTAFGSEDELTRFLQAVEPPAPLVPPAPAVQPVLQPDPLVQAPPPGTPDTAHATVTGRVTNLAGQPEAAVLVRIESANAGASTDADGAYRLVVSRGRFQPGEPVTVTAARTGLSPVSRQLALQPGAVVTQNFHVATAVLLLEDVVVAGAAVSVTNTQHAGVDEGGIVKVHGDYLVVLRRGRLFTVDVAGGRLAPVDAVNAFAPGAQPAAWYDEMLVSGSDVVVIGYGHAGTEINLFGIDEAGRLRHRSTYHLRSNDYYSSRNYASRLSGGKLVLYTPVPAGRARDVAAWMPAVRRWRPGADAKGGGFRPTLRPTRIYRAGRALDARDHVMLHTVTTCELDGGEMDCQSAAVLGPHGRVFYVSPAAVYVWVSDWARGAGLVRPASIVYRLPLDGGAPTALGVHGSPTDQFSFLESADGHLNGLVGGDGGGDGMWRAEWARGDVRLLRVPLSRFGDGSRAAPASAYRALPGERESGAFVNRFVGRHVLYGMGSGWGGPDDRGAALHAVPWAGGPPARVALPHGVDRIEVMGGDAVVIGADRNDLHFTGIRLAGTPRVAQRYVQRQASQGELRSHGFFYRADGPDEGVLGLPVRGPGRPGYEHLFQGSASIVFLRNSDAQFRPLGRLSGLPGKAPDDRCLASCVDWYGNARPLFLRGRTFALLGYELVEGAMEGGRLRELRRVNFTPRAVQAAR